MVTKEEEEKIRKTAEEITQLAKRSTSPKQFTDIVAKILKEFAAEIKKPLVAEIKDYQLRLQQPRRDLSRVVYPDDDDYWAVKVEEAILGLPVEKPPEK